MSSDLRSEIQQLVDAFVADLEVLVRRAALETVAQALGAGGTMQQTAEARPAPPRGSTMPPRRAPSLETSAATRAPAPRAAPSGRGGPRPADLRSGPSRPAPGRVRPASDGRVRRSADQIEATSERIVQHVAQNPGARSEDIRAALDLPRNEWQLTAKRLVEAGRLATRGEKRATVYFVKGATRAGTTRVGPPSLGIVRRPGRGAPATPREDENRPGVADDPRSDADLDDDGDPDGDADDDDVDGDDVDGDGRR